MRAVCLHEQGGIDKLTLDENFPDPQVGEGQVVIRVKATSLNYHDVFTCREWPQPSFLVSTGQFFHSRHGLAGRRFHPNSRSPGLVRARGL